MDILLSEEEDYDRPVTEDERVYLVLYRWWKETRESSFRSSSSDYDETGGVFYTGSSSSCFEPINAARNEEIVLNLRRGKDYRKLDNGEEGVEYALITEAMWLQALKRRTAIYTEIKEVGTSLTTKENVLDVFPLQIRLSFLWETNSLVVRIKAKDNAVEHYKRACKMFGNKSELFRIWDFSGQTTLLLFNDRVKPPDDHSGQPGEEFLLEIQVYGLSDSMVNTDGSIPCNSLVMNGKAGDETSSYIHTNSTSFDGSSSSSFAKPGSLGLTGLINLGNTCFMNSAIQCLSHMPKLVDYFLGDYKAEINHENPLGMNGELVVAFGDLLRKLWSPGGMPVAPSLFKSKLSIFAPQFSGFNQHDSQEFLAFLLDGLHEDLNRVKCKPYIEAKDTGGRPDDELADEYWKNHLARNDSIIVDLFQGQYRSMLVCPVCKKVSVTFDPFMYLSLPLPSTTMRTMTLTVFSSDGTTLPTPFTITVPKYGRFKDLIQALSTACSLRNDETLLVSEIFNNRIIRFLEDPSDSLELIRDDDRLVAYRLPKVSEASPLVVFMHQQKDKYYSHDKGSPSWKMFGIPLVARLTNLSSGSDILEQFVKLLDPFLMLIEDMFNECDDAVTGDTNMEDATSPTSHLEGGGIASETGDGYRHDDFQVYLTDEKGFVIKREINTSVPISCEGLPRSLNVIVRWSNKMVEKYDTCLLSSLPQISKPGLFTTKKPQECVSLYKCLEAFLKEEPLGPEDMWYCPSCKKHRQALKKLDLWRLPEVLIVHLKRFSYSRFLKNKLETFVQFPTDDLDLSTYIAHKDSQLLNHYKLYAVCNHYGGLGGGHYTAFAHHWDNEWYEFDDGVVSPVSEDMIKTSAAYILFYKRLS